MPALLTGPNFPAAQTPSVAINEAGKNEGNNDGDADVSERYDTESSTRREGAGEISD